MNELEIKNICDKIILGEIEFWISEPIDSSNRYLIHKQLDLIPELRSETIIIEGICGKKKIKISKKFLSNENDLLNENDLSNKNDKKIKIFRLDSEQVKFFNKFSKLPIPTNSPENLQYYLDVLKDFYNTNQYDNFISDQNQLGYSKIKNEVGYVKNKIIEHIKFNNEYKNFLSLTKSPSYPDNYIGKSSIYNSSNTNKYYLSIDIKSANWTCLKRNTNSDFTGTWIDFVSKFTPSKFIQESKYFREYVFGELGSKKIDKFMGEILYELEQIIKSNVNVSSWVNKIGCTRDEIIYQIIDPDNFDFNRLIEIVKTIDVDFSTYRVETFYLKQLKPYEYFVKEISKSNDPKSHKIQLKQIPKHFIIQVIKHYTKKPIESMDKKFMFENFICSFDSELKFE
jgi:hypothetical protein